MEGTHYYIIFFRMDYDSDDNEMLESGVVDVGEKGGLSSCGYW